MLRVISTGLSLPDSFKVDPSSEFLPGMIGQLGVFANSVVMGVSDGTAPYGIIDDIKTRAFTSVSWDEQVVASSPGIMGPNNIMVTPVDITFLLQNPKIIPQSFVSNPVPVQLIPNNGAIIIPAGTPLNYDLIGSGSFNAVKTLVRYTYQINNIVGDDSTAGSERVTVWYSRGRYQVDTFETNQSYSINANLFVSEKGLLTTRQSSPNIPSIGIVTAPPSPVSGLSFLEFLLL